MEKIRPKKNRKKNPNIRPYRKNSQSLMAWKTRKKKSRGRILQVNVGLGQNPKNPELTKRVQTSNPKSQKNYSNGKKRKYVF